MKLHRFACFIAGCAFVLIFVGGLVTSTHSSLAVPDWPLSYGQFFPPMVGGILFEHGHRMIAGTVGLLTLALAVWIWKKETRRWVLWLAAAAAGGILLQAVLGGLTVLYLLPHPISIAHACLGQTVFSLLVAIAYATSPAMASKPAPQFDVSWLMTGAIYIQLILGAVMRHTGFGIVYHISWALVVACLVFWAGYKVVTRGNTDWQFLYPVAIVLGLVPAQMMLGVAAYMARAKNQISWTFWPVIFRTSHVAIGAAILATSVIWALKSSYSQQEAA